MYSLNLWNVKIILELFNLRQKCSTGPPVQNGTTLIFQKMVNG